jgi:hypothetical protein
VISNQSPQDDGDPVDINLLFYKSHTSRKENIHFISGKNFLLLLLSILHSGRLIAHHYKLCDAPRKHSLFLRVKTLANPNSVQNSLTTFMQLGTR